MKYETIIILIGTCFLLNKTNPWGIEFILWELSWFVFSTGHCEVRSESLKQGLNWEARQLNWKPEITVLFSSDWTEKSQTDDLLKSLHGPDASAIRGQVHKKLSIQPSENYSLFWEQIHQQNWSCRGLGCLSFPGKIPKKIQARSREPSYSRKF